VKGPGTLLAANAMRWRGGRMVPYWRQTLKSSLNICNGGGYSSADVDAGRG
jgi:hypothetical protein